MAIKDRDGNIYKLRGPNPLLQGQLEWDRSKIKLINLGWKSEVIEDHCNPIDKAKEGIFDIGDELAPFEKPEPKTKVIPARNFIKEINESAAPVVVKKPDPPEVIEFEAKEVVINVEPKLARILKERGVEYFCAPVVGKKKHTDDVYDTSYETDVFGEQYVFDAVVVDQSDLQLQFWCIKPITKNSIILRKVKDGGERWWRIVEVAEKSGGWLVIANTSDLNPDFS